MRPSLLSGALIVALSGFLGYHSIYMRAQAELRALGDQQTHEQKTQEVRAQLAASLNDMERLRKRLPQAPEAEDLMRQVSHLAQESEGQLTALEPQSPASLTDFPRLAVNVQFRSSYHRLGAFLSALESSPMFLKVEDLDVVSMGERESQIRLVVSTLYVPPFAAPSPGGSSGAL